MSTRFEVRLDGFGWPAVWDKDTGCFIPGHFSHESAAAERAEMLNNGRAPIATSAPPATKKSRAVSDDPTLF
jgi:hypothetical protein